VELKSVASTFVANQPGARANCRRADVPPASGTIPQEYRSRSPVRDCRTCTRSDDGVRERVPVDRRAFRGRYQRRRARASAGVHGIGTVAGRRGGAASTAGRHLPGLPTAPENLADAYVVDSAFRSEHREALPERFTAWPSR
jgi:hypothetical protein